MAYYYIYSQKNQKQVLKQKKMYTNAHSNLKDSRKVEAIQMSIN